MKQLGGLSVGRLMVRALRAYRRHQLDARSAQFAYYAMLALAPLLIVILAAVARLPLQGTLDSFLRAVDVGMPDNVDALIRSQVKDIQSRSSWELISGGLVLLAWAGSRMFFTIGAALDAAFDVEQRRRFWKASGLAVLLTFGVFLLLLVAMVLLVVGPLVTDFLISRRLNVHWVDVLLWRGVRWGVACGFMLVATSVIYWVVPSVKLRFRWISAGSLFATTGWVVVTQGFRIYVENFSRYNETYGTLGGVVVLFVWLYLTGSLLMLGGQINAEIHAARQAREAG